jgi:hypothetical protein
MADILPVSHMIQQPNLLAGFQQGTQFGQQQRDRRNGQQAAQLYAQAMQAPPEQRPALLAQIAQLTGVEGATNAQTGLGRQDTAAHDDLVQTAGQFAAIAEADPATAQQMYPSLVAKAHAIGIPVPATYDPRMLPAIQKLAGAMGGAGAVQSTYVDAQGQRVAIMRDGSVRPLGMNAPNNEILDTGHGFYGVNKGNLSAAPVMVGGAPQQTPQGAPGEVPFSIDPSLPATVQASIRANPDAGSEQGITSLQVPQGQQLRSAPKPPPQITPYQQAELDMRRQQLTAAQDARDQAAAARKAADAAKAGQKAEAGKARQSAAMESAQQLVDAIDGLTASPGFNALGTVTGDAMTHIPLVRNDAKDAQAQLDNVAGQVALATMNRLKALSSQGATGFGALSAPELRLLQNSIATLQAGQISHPQLVQSLQVIKNAMQKVTSWHAQGTGVPSSGGAFQVGQIVEHGGKRYRVTGGDPQDPDVEEVR